MTFREGYEIVSLRLKKRKAPALYPQDYTYYANAAITDRCNVMYAKYETTQLLSDDLQNLTRHVTVDISGDMPFPFNITNIDGTPFVKFYKTYPMDHLSLTAFTAHYVDDLNPVITPANYRLMSDNSSLTLRENALLEVPGVTFSGYGYLDQVIFKNVSDGVIIGIHTPMTIRDYRYGENTNYLPYGFNLADQGGSIAINASNPVMYFRYNESTGMFDYIFGNGYTDIGDGRMLIHMPAGYWHATGMTSLLEYKKNIECENTKLRKVGVKRLTDQVRSNIYTDTNVYLHPSLKRRNNYFHELDSLTSVYPDMELLYCNESEKDLVQLKQLDLYYLKEPKKYVLTDEDCQGDDNSESFEFQDYICQEIVEHIELLILERDGNPRMQSQSILNNTNDPVRMQK